MSISALGEPEPLSTLIHNLPTTAGTWFYVHAAMGKVTGALKCFPRVIDSRDMSDDEIDQVEDTIRAAGFKVFLSSDQLEDVLSNLREQRPDATDADIVEAVDFYWKHGAFILADGGAT